VLAVCKAQVLKTARPGAPPFVAVHAKTVNRLSTDLGKPWATLLCSPRKGAPLARGIIYGTKADAPVSKL
jgi:hypothetical protein